MRSYFRKFSADDSTIRVTFKDITNENSLNLFFSNYFLAKVIFIVYVYSCRVQI